MSNKVIINGVDVSECGFRHKDTDNQCHIALAFSEEYGECWHCEQIENCYFKQLQRLKAENEKLKQALEDIRDIVKLVRKDLCNYCDWQNTDSCEPNEYTCGVFSKIQNKINEVLEDA